MKTFIPLVCLLVVLSDLSIALPKPASSSDVLDDTYDGDVSKLSYMKYLKEVMAVLMTDEGFKQKILLEGKHLEDKVSDFSTNLELVSLGIRSQLDELKRRELDRMRKLLKFRSIIQKVMANITNSNEELGPHLSAADKDKLLGHLDFKNVNTFSKLDLERLIKQTTKDLKFIDEKRREAFKNYEMEKQLMLEEKLLKLKEEERKEEERKLKEMQEKHNEHPRLNEPGSEAQLKEVWKETDGLDGVDFDPKTFFNLHDTNSDGMWDMNEIEALMQKELDKVYDPKNIEDDMVERMEDMSRMREHVVAEVDEDKDGSISLAEFIEYSKRKEFKENKEWKAINKENEFNEKELLELKLKLNRLREDANSGVTEHLIVKQEKLSIQDVSEQKNLSDNHQQQQHFEQHYSQPQP